MSEEERDLDKEQDDWYEAIGTLWFSSMRVHGLFMMGIAKRMDKLSDWIESRDGDKPRP